MKSYKGKFCSSVKYVWYAFDNIWEATLMSEILPQLGSAGVHITHAAASDVNGGVTHPFLPVAAALWCRNNKANA